MQSLIVVPIMGGGGCRGRAGGGSRITCSHGHPKHVNASPIRWFSFFSRCYYALVSFVFGFAWIKSLPFNGDLSSPPLSLLFPRFSISLLRHGPSFVQLVGPYLHVTTWFIMRGNVKFFRPFLWALRKSCQPFWFVPYPLGMGLAIEYKPIWCFTSWGPLAISYSWIPFVLKKKGVACLLLSLRSCNLQCPMWRNYMTLIIFIPTIVSCPPYSRGCNKPQKD